MVLLHDSDTFEGRLLNSSGLPSRPGQQSPPFDTANLIIEYGLHVRLPLMRGDWKQLHHPHYYSTASLSIHFTSVFTTASLCTWECIPFLLLLVDNGPNINKKHHTVVKYGKVLSEKHGALEFMLVWKFLTTIWACIIRQTSNQQKQLGTENVKAKFERLDINFWPPYFILITLKLRGLWK